MEKKIDVETKVKNAGMLMLQKLKDQRAIERCTASLTDSDIRLQFLNKELDRLLAKNSSYSEKTLPDISTESFIDSYAQELANKELPSLPDLGKLSFDRKFSNPELLPPPKLGRARSLSGMESGKCDVGLSSAKISIKINDLAYKLGVEQKLKLGNSKMEAALGKKKNRNSKTLDAGSFNHKIT